MENGYIQKLIDINPDAVFIAERDSGRILYFNKIFSRKLNDWTDNKQNSLFELTASSEKEGLLSLLDGRAYEGVFHFRHRDGSLSRHRLYSEELDNKQVLISFKHDLNSSELKYRAELIDNLNDAVIAANLNMEITSWNRAAGRVYGFTEKEALGQNVLELLNTEMTEDERMKYIFDLETKGSVQQVLTRRHRNGTPVFTEANTISIHDENGKISGYVSVNRDVTARLLMLDKLKSSEERYRKLFDENPLPILIYKEDDYSILRANNAAINKYEYSTEEFIKLKIPDLMVPEAKEVLDIIDAGDNREKREGKFYSISKSGKQIYIEYTSTRIRYKEFNARLVVINDITEKQKTEEKLYDFSSKLETIVENLPMVLMELDDKGNFVLQKGKALSSAGFNEGQLVGQSAPEILGEIEITQYNGEVIPAAEVISRVLSGEIIAGHTSISGRYFDNYFVPVMKDSEKATGMLGVCLDITERVDFEKSYHATEERFRLIAENTSELISMVSDKQYMYVSPSYEKVLGYSIDEIKEMGPLVLVHPDDRPSMKHWQEGGMLQFRVRSKSGAWIWMEGESFRITGDPEIVVGIARDITKRKLAEEGLKDSEERYRLLFERNPSPMFVYDEETYKFVAANESAVNHYGYSKDEFLNMTIRDIRPEEDVPALNHVLKTQLPGMNKFGVWRHRRKDGGLIEIDITTHKISFNGRPSRIVLANDVTDKVRAERALRQSEEKYRRIVENANEGILLVDPEASVTFMNNKLAEIIGFTKGIAEGRSVLEFIFDEDVEEAREYIRKNSMGLKETFEFRFKHRDGTERWVTANAVPVFDEDNNYSGGLALITDITHQRKAEAVLQRTNEMLQALINYSPLSIIILDKEGKTELWNPASEKLFGWSSPEVLGKEIPTVPDEKKVEHIELRNTIMQGETITGIEVIRKRKDGKYINISISASPLFDSDHKPIGISSFHVDVTEKKKAEKEREKLFTQITSARNRLKTLSSKLIRVQETEKKNISRELHDEIGQLLTAVKIDLQRIKTDSDSEDIKNLAGDCTKLVEKTISVVRNLSLELRPSMIDDLGLAASIRWYADKFKQRTAIAINAEIKKIEGVISPDCSITLFRVCQEAMTNIAKHSEADYVEVNLSQNKSFVNLTITDNGKGFDVQRALRQAAKGESLGLLNMQERVELIGGKFSIKSIKGAGTSIKVSCQVQKNETNKGHLSR
ncbi:MAG TPA: PAS domain S-box protein [Ignavibacteriaceae bacterium]|nr:PAS domain S-box protein [Ignavibacteriaceae bacterium]